jgi:signal transduction histidine kinase
VASQLARERHTSAPPAAALRAKSETLGELLNGMGHEVRTPLNVVTAFAQILEFDDLTAAQREAVVHILAAGRQVLAIVDEVLEMARIETGRVVLRREPVLLNGLIADAVRDAQVIAAGRSVHLASECRPGAAVMGDPARLREVLAQLVQNAIERCPAGRTVELLAGERPGGIMRIAVRDCGAGIAKELHSRVFLPFDFSGRAPGAPSNPGVGLALARCLAEAMGGAIGLESNAGEGSTFWVDLPAARAKESPVSPSPAAAALPVPQQSV